VSVSFVDRTGWARPEVAFAVNRKVGGAVERNLLRRRMRSILRERTPGLRPGAYLVRCDPTGTALDFQELKVAMSHALEKATSRTAAPTPVGASTRPGGGR
jgi:ribonuclease P protein component